MSQKTAGETGAAARFDGRVENYAAHRPGYPAGVAELLRGELGLSPASVVADVGAGTGLLTEVLLREGSTVFAVEPNDAMRAAMESRLGGHPNFRSVRGTAEATTLGPGGCDFVTAAQAFHWFDPERARAEFRRVLRPGGRAVLVWNMRRADSTPFLRGYELLLREFGTDYRQVNCEQVSEERVADFFGGGVGARRFDNHQSLDLAALRGRLLSMSYVPLAGEPGHGPMLDALGRLFDAHNEGGRVRVEYDTRVYYGRLE